MNVIYSKFKEVVFAVGPIVAIVTLLHFFLIPLEGVILGRFYLGALFIIVGLTFFLIGIDTGLGPIGREMGVFIAKSNKLIILSLGGLILGFIVSIAEPDLHILANQVEMVTSGSIGKMAIVLVVSVGVAVMVMIGLIRIVYNKPLNRFFLAAYALILFFGLFSTRELLAISFDASGATTGALTVPFILAIAYGVSGLKRDSTASEEDSFGLLGIASSGAILGVLAMSVFSGGSEVAGELTVNTHATGTILEPFGKYFFETLTDSALALSPIAVVFFIANAFWIKVPKRLLRRIISGTIFTIVGLVLFMLGVHAGFMEVGSIVGFKLVQLNQTLVLVVSFLIGLVTILAEPAVYVLTHQIEEVTSGYVTRTSVLISLCIGVGLAILLSIVRIIVPDLELWHYLLPGYIIALSLAFFVPPLFVGIAFDAGGVASGPMTATFILAFAHGVASAVEGADVMVDGFGIIAMVAMMPLIALQILGLVFKIKSRKDVMNE